MKKVILLSFVFLLSLSLYGQKTGNLTINVPNANPETKGNLTFFLFDSAEGFPKEKVEALYVGVIKSFTSESVTYTFMDIPYGKYALSIFLDKNRNGELDTGAMGIPKEPVGASNMTKRGKPTFKKCVFDFRKKELTLEVPFITK